MNIDLLTHPMLLPVTLPLAAGLLCLLIPRAGESLRAGLTVLTTAAVLWFAWPVFQAPGTGFEPFPWLALRVDPLSGFVLLAIAFFAFLIAIFSVSYMRGRDGHRAYFAWYLWTLGVGCAAVLANDLLFLLVCWGFLGLLLYLMAGLSGPGAAGAARKSLMIIGGSDAVLLLGILLYWQLSGSTRMGGAGMGGVGIALDGVAAYAAFLAFLAGAFAKAGAVPFHSWLPDFGEHTDAPLSAYLPAALDKLLGIYLLARIMLDLFEPTPGMHLMLMALGAVTIIGAVLMALVQHDLKRLLSYHAVSQVGYMVLGIGTGTAIGLAGGLFHLLNNVIYKSALFLCAGVVEKFTGTTDLDRLGGLARVIPGTFIACTVAALAISGVPPLNGFASKWMIYQGVITSGDVAGWSWILWLAAAMLGSALTLASFVKVLHATFLCKPAPGVKDIPTGQHRPAMLLPLAVLALLCIVFGVFAFRIPLSGLIFPVVGVEVTGVWWSGTATVLILAAIFIGLLVYWLALRGGGIRRVSSWVGGERLDEVYVSGEAEAGGRHLEVTGVDFYRTIEELPGLRRYYALTRQKAFDIYHQLRRSTNYVTGGLRAMHSGILPAYLRWFIAGMLVVVWAVTQMHGGP